MASSTSEQFGLICSSAELAGPFLQLLRCCSIRPKAIWCPNQETSIELATTNNISSVATTPFQVLRRPDVHHLLLTGPPAHHALLAMQAIASGKRVSIVGVAALSVAHARALRRMCAGRPLLSIIYGLRYSSRARLLLQTLSSIGRLETIKADVETAQSDAVGRISHELLDLFAFLTETVPRRHSVMIKEKSNVVDHFRMSHTLFLSLETTYRTTNAVITISVGRESHWRLQLNGDRGKLLLENGIVLRILGDAPETLNGAEMALEEAIGEGVRNALAGPCVARGNDELEEALLLCTMHP